MEAFATHSIAHLSTTGNDEIYVTFKAAEFARLHAGDLVDCLVSITMRYANVARSLSSPVRQLGGEFRERPPRCRAC
jgi:hypothetical protein